MTIAITCPGCQSVYPVPETLIGKTIRCKQCGEMMAVTAPPPPALPARPIPAAPVAARPVLPASRVVLDEDDRPNRPTNRRERDEGGEDAPRGKGARKKGSSLPLILGSVIGVIVLGGGVIGALFAAGIFDSPTEPTDVADNSPPAQVGPPGVFPPGMTTPEATRPMMPPPKGSTPSPAAAPVTKAAGEDPLVVKPIKPITPIAATRPAATTTPSITPERLMSGLMDKAATERVARATVLILGEGQNGSAWTGSGWFGIEPGLVFTNAHVLDMLAPDSKPPTKLTIYTYKPDASAGARIAPDKMIPHSKIKILAVDRTHDLALLQIINEPDLPVPLPVRPSSELQIRQGVTTFGFPLTDVLQLVGNLSRDKMPEMSVRPTNVTALRQDALGRPRFVQTEGAQNSGNSGGPIVDAEGYVVAVVVAGVLQDGSRTQLSLSVPTEWVFGLLAGRVEEAEFDQPYRKDGKVRIPVTVKCLDPMKRLQRVGIEYWVGDRSPNPRPHGERKPEKLPTDQDHRFLELKYDPTRQVAAGELEFPELSSDQAYWTQPFYANAVQPNGYYLPGVAMQLSGPPVDRVPTDLVVKLPVGSIRPVELSNSRNLAEFEEGEGASKNERVLRETTLKMDEAVQAGNPQVGAAAQLRFRYKSIDLKRKIGARDDEAPKKLLAFLNQNIARVEALAYVNKSGETFRYLSNIRDVPDPTLGPILQNFSDDAMEALQACSIPLPNRQVKPLEKWESKKLTRLHVIDLAALEGQVPSDEPIPGGSPRKGPTFRIRELKFEQRITYTYLGMRQRLGSMEAVIRVEGQVGQAPGAQETASGQLKGYVMVEVQTGAVTLAELESEFEVDSSSGGIRKKLSGLNQYKLTRGSAAK